MTRTARAENPAALVKDRSIARNGRDKSIQKGGFHGWGNIKDEATLEREGQEDEEVEKVDEDIEAPRRERRGSTLGEVKGESDGRRWFDSFL